MTFHWINIYDDFFGCRRKRKMCFWLRPSFPIMQHITCFCNVMLLLLPSSNHLINQHSSSQIKITHWRWLRAFFWRWRWWWWWWGTSVLLPLNANKKISDEKTFFLCMPHYNFVDCSLTPQMVTYCLRLNIPLVFALNSSRSPRYFFTTFLHTAQLNSVLVNERMKEWQTKGTQDT